MQALKFLMSYRGVLSGEQFYEAGQVVFPSEVPVPMDVDGLVEAGRAVRFDADKPKPVESPESLPEDGDELEDLVEAGDIFIEEESPMQSLFDKLQGKKAAEKQPEQPKSGGGIMNTRDNKGW